MNGYVYTCFVDTIIYISFFMSLHSVSLSSLPPSPFKKSIKGKFTEIRVLS